MDFCHIAPTPHLSVTDGRPVHLVLAHLIEEDEDYVNYYLQQKEKYGCMIIMDNSAFEMYKQNRPMYDSSKLITMGARINADYIVLSDYPDSDPENTIEAAMVMAPVIKEEGFGTFFVPQGNKGSIDDLLYAFKFAATVRRSPSPLNGYTICCSHEGKKYILPTSGLNTTACVGFSLSLLFTAL